MQWQRLYSIIRVQDDDLDDEDDEDLEDDIDDEDDGEQTDDEEEEEEEPWQVGCRRSGADRQVGRGAIGQLDFRSRSPYTGAVFNLSCFSRAGNGPAGTGYRGFAARSPDRRIRAKALSDGTPVAVSAAGFARPQQ